MMIQTVILITGAIINFSLAHIYFLQGPGDRLNIVAAIRSALLSVVFYLTYEITSADSRLSDSVISTLSLCAFMLHLSTTLHFTLIWAGWDQGIKVRLTMVVLYISGVAFSLIDRMMGTIVIFFSIAISLVVIYYFFQKLDRAGRKDNFYIFLGLLIPGAFYIIANPVFMSALGLRVDLSPIWFTMGNGVILYGLLFNDDVLMMPSLYKSQIVSEMRESESDYREMLMQAVLDAQPGMVIVTDGKTLHMVNRQMLNFFHYDSLADFSREHPRICDFFLPGEGYLSDDGSGEWAAQLHGRIGAGENVQAQIKDLATGDIKIFRLDAVAFPDSSGRLIITFADVTDIVRSRDFLENQNRILDEMVRKKTSQLDASIKQLLISQERLNEAQRVSRMGHWESDIDGSRIFLSKTVREYIGMEEDDKSIAISDFLTLIHPEDRSMFEKIWGQMVRAERDSFEISFRMQNDETGYINYKKMIGRSESDSQGRWRYFGTIQDVTEISIRENEKKRNSEILIYQSRMAVIGELIGFIVHQWKQPLSVLLATGEDIEDAFEYGELNKAYLSQAVHRISEQISQLQHSVEDFRDFFKPSPEKVLFEAASTASEMVNFLLRHLGMSEIGIELENRSGMPLIVSGYPNELKHVLLNLINNSRDSIVDRRAADPNSPTGMIKLIFNLEGNEVVIDCLDNGNGVEDTGVLFEPYYSGPDSGTGVGLYMSKIILEKMNGTLRIIPRDSGTNFQIRLPFIQG